MREGPRNPPPIKRAPLLFQMGDYQRGFVVGLCTGWLLILAAGAVFLGLYERDQQCKHREFGQSIVTFRCPK